MSLLDGKDHDVRIKLIDARSAAIERELLQTDDAIAKALASGVTTPGGRTIVRSGTTTQDEALRRMVGNVAEEAVMSTMAAGAFTILGFYVLWRGFRRWIWKRKPAPQFAAADQTPRLDHLQQSVDVIALEVERISEAQRFLAKVLNEKIPALGAGDARPIATRAREEVRDERR